LYKFEKYVFLVRNLRGVYAPLPKDEHERYVGWLVKRYRYRDLGVIDCIVENAKGVFEDKLSGNPFHVLEPPTESLAEAIEDIAGMLAGRINLCLARSLLYSLVYASPLYLTGASLEELRRGDLVLYEVKGSIPDLNSARLHMRIVGYTVLDYYVESVEKVANCIRRGCKGEDVANERRAFAERDSKRYWRISGKGEETVVAYLDHVHVLLEDGFMERVGRLTEGEPRVLLAMPVGFVLDSALRS
jgi:hypothetical protein